MAKGTKAPKGSDGGKKGSGTDPKNGGRKGK